MTPMIRLLALVGATALAVLCGAPAFAQAPAKSDAPKADAPAKTDAPAKSDAPAAAPAPAPIPPKRFASAEDAVNELVAALKAGDNKKLVTILGSAGRSIVSSGDAVADQQGRDTFLKAYDAGHKLVVNGNTTTLTIGDDEWPFPVPIVKDGDRWRFDTRKGREEILARRIGRNELYTIQTCLAYVDAQREYYSADRNGDGILEYARQFASTTGMRNGLYWPTKEGEPPSPLGDLVVRARAEGYRRDKSGGPTPYHGYLYRILTAQGTAAPGGAYDYIVHGHMIAGFALVAFPAEYGVSGVMTFMVNHDGVVYQKDLGPGTRAAATAMRAFNPDGTWAKVAAPDLAVTPGAGSK